MDDNKPLWKRIVNVESEEGYWEIVNDHVVDDVFSEAMGESKKPENNRKVRLIYFSDELDYHYEYTMTYKEFEDLMDLTNYLQKKPSFLVRCWNYVKLMWQKIIK